MYKILADRAKMMGLVRAFFSERNILEVDCPILLSHPSIDVHLEPMQLKDETRYLHTSPEYAMKRLLSVGIGDIYQLSHVFRKGDLGHLHNPEFTMIEWYRIHKPLNFLIQETIDLMALFFPSIFPIEILTYQEAIKRFARFEKKQNHWDEETYLDYIWASEVEPKLGHQKFTAICNFPPQQAELSQIKDGYAQRFEIYFQGIELANGYHELTDFKEQKQRLLNNNEKRILNQKNSLPIDHYFLDALEKRLPDCCGVAVGFDRLMLLRHKKHSIKEVLPFSWENI